MRRFSRTRGRGATPDGALVVRPVAGSVRGGPAWGLSLLEASVLCVECEAAIVSDVSAPSLPNV